MKEIRKHFVRCSPPSNDSDDSHEPEKIKIVAPDGALLDEFGKSVAIYERNIIIGAYKDNDNGFDSGSAYLFSSNGSFSKKLIAPDGEADDGFGYTVAISSSVAVVGAHVDDDFTGAAYIFQLNNTANVTKITAPEGAADDRFGWSVAISGDIIAVGALFDVFLFTSDGEFITELTPEDGNTMFGNSVALTDEVIVVGGFRDSEDTGSVHVYSTDGEYLTRLEAPDGAANDQFGYDVAVFRDTIVVGSPLEGAAYIYSVDGTLIKKLTPLSYDNSGQFGRSVTVSEEIMAIGAHLNDNFSGVAAGVVYIYKKNGEFMERLFAFDGEGNEYFGSDVSIEGDYLVVGANGDDDLGEGSGSASIYKTSTFTQSF